MHGQGGLIAIRAAARDAFLIEDGRLDQFFRLIGYLNSAQKYVTLLHRFRDFAMSHDSWLEPLSAADHGHSPCNNKLTSLLPFGLKVGSKR
jgi:hypothetical protein